MPRQMTQSQHDKLMLLAENPATATKLLQQFERTQRLAKALWDVYCVAILTVSSPH